LKKRKRAGATVTGYAANLPAVQWLNYHHLLYFWTVAKEGSVSAASKKLRLAQPTLSGQIHALEEQMEVKLFRRQGRGLALTESGQVAFRYADEIFSLGKEMQTALRGETTGRPVQFNVGVTDVLPKLVAFHLLEPAFKLKEKVLVKCEEDRVDRLLTRLATHELDIVLSDSPANPMINVRVFNHLLGECDVSFFAQKEPALAMRKKFPKCLAGAPFLMPSSGTSLRRSLDAWFERQGLMPDIVAEFDDSGLLKTFGQAGMGVFAAPSIVSAEICRQYNVRLIGRTSEIKERFYAISAERRLRHPAVVAVSEAARNELFKST